MQINTQNHETIANTVLLERLLGLGLRLSFLELEVERLLGFGRSPSVLIRSSNNGYLSI
jgi:hypothetical protein